MQDTGQVTGQDNLMENKEKSISFPRDTQRVTEQDTGQVAQHANQLVSILAGEMSRAELQAALN